MMFKYWQLAMTKHYAKFDGRSDRPEYWWMTLVNLIIALALGLLGQASTVFLVLYFIFAIAILIPGIAAAVRRLHDTGRSGAWVLIALVPLVGGIILLVFLASAGTPGPNQYGPPPAPLVS